MLAIGNKYCFVGKKDEAIDLSEKLLERLIQVHGPEHHLSVQEMGSLGFKFYEQTRYNEAESVLQKTFDGLRRLHGDSHIETQRILAVLADVKGSKGETHQAEVMFRVAIDGILRCVGEDNTEYLTIALKFAVFLNANEKYLEAATFGRKVFETFARTQGYSHQHTINSLFPYTESLVNSGLPGTIHEATALLRHMRDECSRTYGTESPQVERIESAIGDIHKVMNSGHSDLARGDKC